MRALLLIFIGLNTGQAFAGNYWPLGKQNANKVYAQKSDCESKEGVDCVDITGKDLRFHVARTTEVEDNSKPIYKTQYDVEACQSANECQALVGSKTCSQGDNAAFSANTLMPGFKAYCTGIEGYEKKEVKELVLDSQLQNQVLAADAVKAANESAIQTVMRHMRCGGKVKAIVSLRNSMKQMTAEQVKEFTQNFLTIAALLDAGALVTAKGEVQSIAVGPMVSEEDKESIVSAIDACLAGQ